MNPHSLARILQLASQALPIGGYSHSQGLEAAIEHRIVRDESSVLEWISDVADASIRPYEIPCLLDFHAAWAAGDAPALARFNDEFVASRESSELRAATLQMGFSMRALAAVLPDLPAPTHHILEDLHEPCLPCVWSAVAAAWSIEPRDSAIAYVWSWAENQVLVAMKTLPMGQSAGQRVLAALGRSLTGALQAGPTVDKLDRSNFAPALAILCSQHETQYSRLFRS